MSILSIQYLLFVAGIILLYFLAPKKRQWVVLFIANILFYVSFGIKYIGYILFTSVITYCAARKLETVSEESRKAVAAAEKEQKKSVREQFLALKNRICDFAILISVGIWVVIKYGNFIIDNVNAVLKFLHISRAAEHLPFIIPLGMSFFTFHAVGYLLDVYRAKYPAEKSFLRYFTFVSFFPHLLQGPFSRFDEVGKSIFEEHSFSYDRFCEGCSRIAWGFFKKVVVADQLGIVTAAVFQHYTSYTGTHILMGIVFYGIQLYADFSGYMDIVCGISHILGIRLPENFAQPYFARTIDDFWRRWHITLGRWFRDYVFYPVSMGKFAQQIGRKARAKWGPKMGKLVPGYYALIFVWTATGLWHGASWTFLIWGWLNLFVITSTMQLDDWYTEVKAKLHINDQGKPWILFCIIRTFLLVCFFRFFSTADSVSKVWYMMKHAVLHLNLGVLFSSRLFPGLKRANIAVILIGIVLILIVDILKENDRWESVKAKSPMLVRNFAYTFLIIMSILFAAGGNELTKGFMYANF
jgi:D-alanyl-lipoteichoic acid acyltransferase DltB (MBOAT superfamily)